MQPMSSHKTTTRAIIISSLLLLTTTVCATDKNLHQLPELTARQITTNTTTNFNNIEAINCYDGDTCKVNILNSNIPSIFSHNIPIRVKGIDTAELRGTEGKIKELAYKARSFSNKFIRGGYIRLTDCTRGKYFRLVCNIVNSQGHNLATELLNNNLAKPYGSKSK